MEIAASVEPNNCQSPLEIYEPMLKESILRFLADYQNGVSNFSCFSSIFSRILQTMTDPPLEFTWFYSAVTFRTHERTIQDPLERVMITKNLFQVLVSCSSPCNGLTRVSLLAPVLRFLYELTTDKNYLECKRETNRLIEGVVTYTSLCCKDIEETDGSVRLGKCFLDLVHVWTIDKIVVNGGNVECLRAFLPLVNDEIRCGIGEGCEVGYFAGVVMCEAFLLMLCLKFGAQLSRVELQKDMQKLAVDAIMGSRNWYFYDILLKMLLDPVLPVSSLLNREDEAFLRNILYDAVIMVEYLFLSPHKVIQLPDNKLKNLALRWLFVADNAIRSIRENGDQAKLISYINAFSGSCLISQLVKWVVNQFGVEDKTTGPNISTPVALIKWLLNIEDQGVRVFDHDFPKLHAKEVIYKSRVEYEFPTYNHFFYSDNEGRMEDKVDEDEEMFDSVDTGFDGKRKRRDEGNTQVKFFKVHLHENTAREKFLPFGNDDGMNSGSEVDNPVPV